MTRFIVGQKSELDDSVYDKLLRYRHRIFVQTLGWRVATPSEYPDYEQDEFDTEGTVYVVAVDPREQVVGCVRLLPTTQPYLLQALFPGLAAHALQRRSSTRTWELSRFACSGSRTGVQSRQAAQLLAEGLRTAQRLGAQDVIGILSGSVERFCHSVGLTLERLAPPLLFEGQPVVACALDLAAHLTWIEAHAGETTRTTGGTPIWS